MSVEREVIETRVDAIINLLLAGDVVRVKLKSFKTIITKDSLNADPAQRDLMITTVEEGRPFTVMLA